jgi:transposase-like protein
VDLILILMGYARERWSEAGHVTLEEMRLRAVAAVEAGRHPEDVAATLGMARSTVFGWIANNHLIKSTYLQSP